MIGCGPTVLWRGRSADREVVASVMEEGGEQHVEVDDEPEAPVDAGGISELRFCAHHLAYPARVGTRWRVVSAGVAGPVHDAIGELRCTSRRVAYEVRDRDGWRVVVDGVAGPRFDSLRRGSLRFVADGGHVLYVGRDARGDHVVVDGVVGPAFPQVERLALGAKETTVAYAGLDPRTARIVVDGRTFGPYDEVLALEAARAEPHWAAIVTRGGVPAIVRDGAIVAEQPGAMELRISDDGAHVAWTAQVDRREALFLDGAPVGTYDAVEQLELPAGEPLYLARDADAVRVIHGGTPGPRVEGVDALVTSADGHFAYVAARGVGRLVVVDGVLRYRGEWAGALVLAERGGRWAFVTRHGARRAVVTPDGETEVTRPFVDTLVLDADGRHWAVANADPRTHRLEVLVDGRAVALLDPEELASSVVAAHDPATSLREIVTGELARALRRAR